MRCARSLYCTSLATVEDLIRRLDGCNGGTVRYRNVGGEVSDRTLPSGYAISLARHKTVGGRVFLVEREREALFLGSLMAIL